MNIHTYKSKISESPHESIIKKDMTLHINIKNAGIKSSQRLNSTDLHLSSSKTDDSVN